MKKTISLICFLLLFAVIMPSSLLTSCNNEPEYESINKETAVIIGEREFSNDLYRFFYLSYKNTPDTDHSESALREKTETALCEIAATLDKVDELGMTLPDDTKKEIADYIDTLRGAYESAEEYRQYLASGYHSEQTLYEVTYYTALEELLYSYMTADNTMVIRVGDKELDEALERDFMVAYNIVIGKETEKDGKKGRELAEYVRKLLTEGEDIEELAERYSIDSYTAPRYFAPHTMMEYFENKVKSLEIGEISDIYESELGYNITVRTALDKGYIKDNYEALREELKYSEFLAGMLEKSENYAVVYADTFVKPE